jgi:hypothetical protein
MKYFSFLLVPSIMTAVVSFAVAPGMAAIILRIFSAVLLVSFGIALLHSKRVKLANKPVPATFATSFGSDIEKP